MSFQGESRAGSRPLSRMDRYMLDFQRAFPTRPVSVSSYVLRVAGTPSLGDVRAAVTDRVQAFPVLTERLVERRGRSPRWETGGVLDAASHVREYPLPEDLSDEDLRATALRLSSVATPLDKPAWEIFLLTSPGARETHVLYRSSHVWVDGLSHHRVLTYLFGNQAAASAEPAWLRSGTVTPGALLAAARHQATTWAKPSSWPAELARQKGHHHSVHWASIGIDRLRAVGKAFGGSVNDAYLVALGGAIAAWSPQIGPWPLRAVLSVGARRPEEGSVLGNAFVATRVSLPTEPAPAAERFEMVHRQTAPYKGGANTSLGVRFWSDLVPTRLGHKTIGSGQVLRTAAVNAANLGLIAGPLTVAGHPVVAAMPVPAPRFGRRQVVVTLGGLGKTATAGFTVPTPRGAELAALWLAEIENLEREADIASASGHPVHGLAAGPGLH